MNNISQKIRYIQNRIKKEVGKQKAIIAVSGGIDSSVCAVLSNLIIPEQLYPVYIRSGFNLYKEEKNLITLFKKFGMKIKILKREKEYFTKLKNIEDSTKRRFMFGVISLQNLKKYAESIDTTLLINGVNKNDILVSNFEKSYKKRAAHIRTILGLKLVEPVANLRKEEIKNIAQKIGLGSLVNKQHIPGPALAVRIAGRIIGRKLNLLKKITNFIEDKVKNKNQLWQYFPFLLNEKLDNKYIVVLRFVASKNGLKAKIKYDENLLERLANNILKKFPDVGRVFFDLSPKPPATIELM